MTRKEIHQRYFDKLKADPERYTEYKRRMREKARLYRKANSDKVREARQQYIANIKADPELYAEYLAYMRENRRKYREARREELAEKERERREADPERYNRMIRERLAANPDKKRGWARKDYAAHADGYKRRSRERRVRKVNATGHHTEVEWQALCSYYMDQCLSCGDVPDKLTRDHVVPLIKGGSDDIGNIQPLCRSCNDSKGTKTIDYRV